MQQLSKFGVDDSDISMILLENDLDGDEVITDAAGTLRIKKALFYALPGMIAGLTDVTEGGYSIKWNAAALKAWISALASFLKLPDPFKEPEGIIRGRNVW